MLFILLFTTFCYSPQKDSVHHKKKNEVPPPESNGALDIAMLHINTREL